MSAQDLYRARVHDWSRRISRAGHGVRDWNSREKEGERGREDRERQGDR